MGLYAALIAALLTADSSRPVDFDTDILPVLTRAGCNAGACHGAAAGRGGFHLSLFGSDPAADYTSIVVQLKGRRVNLSSPGESLLLLKATQQIDHGGGDRLEHEGADAARLLDWIRAGAPRGDGPELTEFQVFADLDPAPRRGGETRDHGDIYSKDVTAGTHRSLVVTSGRPIPLRAVARFEGAATRDVTPWTVLVADDPSAAIVDSQSATITLPRPGRHIVVARYLDRVLSLEFLVPWSDADVDLSAAPRRNPVDRLVYGRLETLRLPVSPQADDATFLRRARLDLTGRLPSPDELSTLETDRHIDRRERLVDRLIHSDEFAEFWTYRFARLLRIGSEPQDRQGAQAYHRWLRQQISRGMGFDRWARELITASGNSHAYGPANFYRTTRDARGQAELVSELFMGVRLRCANCHDHPLDRWTQDDYHGLAAIFAKVQAGRTVTVVARGQVIHPRSGQAAQPRIPASAFLADTGDPRTALADWLTRPDNPYFARALVNRLWRWLMGRGLVEPPDDMRATNPATHPELLDLLADDFVRHGYDFRRTVRLIATSAAYARSAAASPTNAAGDAFYGRALARPLVPEVLADGLADVTGVWDEYGELPLGTRAITLFDPAVPAPALDILGRCAATVPCETISGMGLARKLHLINGSLINRRITAPEGRLHQQLAAGRSNAQIIEEFYLRSLGRLPSPAESAFWMDTFANTTDERSRRELAEDFLWSLLTCHEFVTNH